MKTAIIIFVVAIAAIANAADEETCVVGGLTMKKGESKNAPIGTCMKYTCESKDSISALGCAAIAVTKNCTLSDSDNTKEYPACCPVLKCNKK